MPAKLTQIFVERQPFTSTGTRWITDTELKGFSLAIGRTVKTYYAAAEVGGRLLRRKLGHADVLTAPQARNLAKEMPVDAAPTTGRSCSPAFGGWRSPASAGTISTWATRPRSTCGTRSEAQR